MDDFVEIEYDLDDDNHCQGYSDCGICGRQIDDDGRCPDCKRIYWNVA